MSKSKGTYTLQANDKVNFGDNAPFTVTLFQRDPKDAEKILGILHLDVEFEHRWQAAKTRQAIVAAGQINLANWHEANPYTPPAF